jgi:3-oxoacyl-[acyl-carrier protein] reductase
MEMGLASKVALVTGGSRGIGRAVASALAGQGMDVAICGRTAESLERTAAELRACGVRCWPVVADVSRVEDIERLVASVLRDAGRIDVLVNNAVTSTSAPFDQLGDAEFRYHIDVKLMAYIRIARLVLADMAQRRFGRIVNIGGMTARIVAPLRMTNGVVNAGVANFTKQFAGYAAQYGVTVNCIHPGYTATERVDQIFDSEARQRGVDRATVVADRTKDIPLGRLVRPEDIAGAVLYFCSPWAEIVTGQAIAVDGGSGQAVAY